MQTIDVPVLIIGGGVTGLAAATFLDRLGIQSMTIERHPATSTHPKARAINPRATEALRTVGLEQAMFERRSPIADHVNLIHMESLAGRERMRMPRPGGADVGRITPAGWSFIDQSSLEPLLVEHLDPARSTVRFNCEWIDLTPNGEDGVDVVLRDRESGERSLVTASYVIAADGSRSQVRKHLGIGTSGAGTLEHMVSFFLRTDLGRFVSEKRLIAAYILNDRVQGTFLPLDLDGRWVFNVSYDPQKIPDVRSLDRTWCEAMAQAGIGTDEVEVVIEDDHLIPWEISARVADRMRSGNVFIAGDAAHVMPPTGAFGASSGILDAHNLCWKLAHVLNGVADRSLLNTYESERLPMARLVVGQSMVRFRFRQGGSREQFQQELIEELPMCFGFCYGPQAGTVYVEDPNAPSAAVGARAPHVQLKNADGTEVSTIDLVRYGRSTLFVDAGSADWAATVSDQADPEQLDAVIVGGDDWPDQDGTWRASCHLDAGGALLVRPDGFVAWRATGSTELPDPAAVSRLAELGMPAQPVTL